MIESVSWRADPENYLAQHDLVFEKESQTWESGLAIGNGDLGALHYIPQSPRQLQWLINKSDLWDLRHHFNMDPQPYATHDQVMAAICKNPKASFGQFDKPCFPHRAQNTQKSAAMLRIGPWGIGAAENTSYLVYISEIVEEIRQRLRIFDGVAETDIYTQQRPADQKTHVESFVHSGRNLMVVDVVNPPPWPVELYRWTDDTFGYPPETFAEGDYFGLEYPFPDVPTLRPQPYPELHNGFRYVVVARIVGTHYRTYAYPNRAIADFDFPSHAGYPLMGPVKDYRIYVAVVTSMESKDPRAAAQAMIEHAAAEDRVQLKETHRTWWRNFWNQSFIELPDKTLENLWYFGLYQLACCSRGKLLPGIAGLWFGPDLWPGHYDAVFCQGAYTQDQNTTVPHYWTLAANHPELLDNYLDTFTRLVPMAKCLTKEMFGIDGMHMPLTNTPLGIETTPFHGRYGFISSPLTALLFWMHYDFLKDLTVLNETIYPFLKESCLFFLNYMHKGPDGKYVLYPAYPSEQSRELGLEHNPTGILMMLKALLQKTREACRELMVDPDLEARIVEMLDHFPDYPTGQGCFLQSADELDPTYHRHVSRIEAGFHNGEIDPDRPNQERDTLINTLRALTQGTYWEVDKSGEGASFSIFYIGGTLAYLKWPQEVMLYLYGYGLAQFLKPNGMIGEVGLVGKNVLERQETSTPVLEGIGAIANIVTEMLIQSYHEVIQVFPCVPDSWKKGPIRFADLRARGAFRVDAQMTQGRVDYVAVVSEKQTLCRIKNPNPGSTPAVSRQTGPQDHEPHTFEVHEELISFSTKPGQRYLICWANLTAILKAPALVRANPADRPRIIQCPEGQIVTLGRIRPHIS